jgi:hypothetical protein
MATFKTITDFSTQGLKKHLQLIDDYEIMPIDQFLEMYFEASKSQQLDKLKKIVEVACDNIEGVDISEKSKEMLCEGKERIDAVSEESLNGDIEMLKIMSRDQKELFREHIIKLHRLTTKFYLTVSEEERIEIQKPENLPKIMDQLAHFIKVHS